MRLAVLTSHPIQYYSPIFRELAKRLDLHVYYATRSTARQQADAGFGVEFEWDVDILAGHPHSFLENVSAVPSPDTFSGCDTPGIGEALRVGGHDALLILGWHLKSFLQGLWSAKRLGMPVMVRGDSQLQTPRSGLKRLAKAMGYPLFLRAYDAALYVGQRSCEYYRAYGYPQRRLYFSPHCVDTEWFAARSGRDSGLELRRELGIPPDAAVALYAGKLTAIKRPVDFVEALGALRRGGREVVGLMAGAGPLEAETAALAARHELTLHRLGFQNQSEMPRVYSAADVLVLPGRETWGLVCNEALACGTALAVSDEAGCAPDLVADSTAGRVARCGDVASLAEAIDTVLRAPPNPEALRRKSDEYSVAAAVGGIQAALRQVVI